MRNLFTSEQVTQGHPDRMADQLSDAVLDYCLAIDKKSRVACEVMVKDHTVVFGGEITTSAKLDNEVLKNITKRVLRGIGYKYEPIIINLIGKQSPQINQGVDKEDGTLGAGDQGIVFGYATNETKSGHKLSFHLCNEIIAKYDEVRFDMIGGQRILGADAKTQVTIDYTGEVPKIDTVLISASLKCDEDEFEYAKDFILNNIIMECIKGYDHRDVKILINPAGYWSYDLSGPIGDAGVTGRKIVCDQYGGSAPVGGGAFSGKDPTKVDRSASYMARHLAKIVVNTYGDLGVNECLIQLSYAIGVPQPISIQVKTDTSLDYVNKNIAKFIQDSFDLSPSGIIKYLDLLNMEYIRCAKYGHMSSELFNWEKSFYELKTEQTYVMVNGKDKCRIYKKDIEKVIKSGYINCTNIDCCNIDCDECVYDDDKNRITKDVLINL